MSDLTEATLALSLQATVLLAAGLLLDRLLASERLGARSPKLRHGLLLGLLLALVVSPLVPSLPGVPVLLDLSALDVAELSAVAEPADGSRPAATSGTPDAASSRLPTSSLDPVGGLLLLGWIVFFARFVAGLGSLRRLRADASPPPSPSCPLSDDDWERLLPARRRPTLLTGHLVSVPMTVGVFDPVILLPDSFRDLPREQRRAILVHEILHVRRRDWLTVTLGELVRCALWFHPLVWILLSELTESREQVIDRETVRFLSRRRPYLRALLRFAQGGHAPLAAAITRPGSARRRIRALLEEEPMSTRVQRIATPIAFSVVCLLAAAAAGAFPLVGTAPEGQEPVAAPQAAAEGSAQEDEPIHVSEAVTPPQHLEAPPPSYTEEARRARIQGVVIVQTVIDREGRVTRPKVVKGLPMGLSQQALEAVRSWRFEPARLDGEAVPVYFNLTVNFRIAEPGSESEIIVDTPSGSTPTRVTGDAPRYTDAARRAGIEGDVTLRVQVDPQGLVREIRVVEGLSHGLGEAAAAAVWDWAFEPVRVNGEPMAATFLLNVSFTLD